MERHKNLASALLLVSNPSLPSSSPSAFIQTYCNRRVTKMWQLENRQKRATPCLLYAPYLSNGVLNRTLTMKTTSAGGYQVLVGNRHAKRYSLTLPLCSTFMMSTTSTLGRSRGNSRREFHAIEPPSGVPSRSAKFPAGSKRMTRGAHLTRFQAYTWQTTSPRLFSLDYHDLAKG